MPFLVKVKYVRYIQIKYKSLLIGPSTIVIILTIIVYAFYEKNRKQQLYKDFKANKRIICDYVIVQKNRSWTIRDNRFFYKW